MRVDVVRLVVVVAHPQGNKNGVAVDLIDRQATSRPETPLGLDAGAGDESLIYLVRNRPMPIIRNQV